MNLWKRYVRAESVAEAVQALGDSASIIAGGTDLLLDLDQGRHPPVQTLIDVSDIPELRAIEPDGDLLFIGAAVPLREIIENQLVQQNFRGLVQACELIGGPQIRNVATLGGNVAHALPAGDGTIALLALGAEAQLAGKEGRSWVNLEHLFVGPGKPAFDRSCELLVGFRIPLLKQGESSAFQRIMRAQGVAIAILNMSVRVRISEESTIDAIRLALGPAGPTPFRALQTEEYFSGRKRDRVSIEQAAEVLMREVNLRTSPHRATKEYRQHLLRILLERTLNLSMET
jgi:carbon-monoxide dehydrogenase medium subunit